MELFNNPYVEKILQSCSYTLYPTRYDTSYQNGPVEQSHRIFANSIWDMLFVANVDIKCSPYDLYHDILLSHYFPEPHANTSIIDKDIFNWWKLSYLCTIVSHVYMQPPRNKKIQVEELCLQKKIPWVWSAYHSKCDVLWSWYPQNQIGLQW